MLGNALERGIAYNSMRVESLSRLEVVLGNGRLITCGSGDAVSTRHLYKHGIGPNLDGLFVQSNYGIVTAATYQLTRRRPRHFTFHLGLSETALPVFLERLRTIREDYHFDSIVHVGNEARTRFTLKPLVESWARESGRLSPEQAWRTMSRQTHAWTAVGNISGPPGAVRELKRALKRAFGGLGTLRLYSKKQLAFGRRVARLLRLDRLDLLLRVAGEFEGLNHGVPTDATLSALIEPNRGVAPAEAVDGSHLGILFCVPLAPLRAADGQRMVEIAQLVCADYGFGPEITLNALTARLLEAVISVSFDKRKDDRVAAAHACIRALHQALMGSGYHPYRVSTELMDLIANDGPEWQTVAELKQVLDPCHIIAPGRYNRL